MKYQKTVLAVLVLAAVAAGVGYERGLFSSGGHERGDDRGAARPQPDKPENTSVDLTESQVAGLKIEPLGRRSFVVTQQAVGSIDFNQDRLVQVFTPYQGRLIALFAQIGDEVKAGQPLFTVDSADLLQAEATLLQTAGVLGLTTSTLARNQKLLPVGGGAQKDIEQAKSDQQTAEGNFRAARDALHIFGKDDADIDRVLKERRVDSVLVVKSPIDGVVTSRAGAPGLFIQPGSAPAPYSVADLSTKWMNANVIESESSRLKIGQAVRVRVVAYPDRIFDGRVSAIGASVDATSHRFLVRSEINDPERLLRPGMFASFVIVVSNPTEAPALPKDGAVREGDGTMSAWVTTDRRHFTRRIVQIGLQQDGFDEIRSGLEPGELVVTDGAIFLSNMLESGSAAD